MPEIPPELLPKSRQIILPLVSTEDEREALLTDAFYGVSDSRLFHQIKREGTPMSFTTLCLKKLLDYGCLAESNHALAQLLSVTKYYCGVQQHATIDGLVELTNQLCADIGLTKPEEKPVVTSAPITTPTQTLSTPRDERTPTVFISYSHGDTKFAKKLIADLNRVGHACWIDTVKIKGGDEWIQSITEGINNSYAFISVVSEPANNSTWVRREFLWAEHKKKRIFPVMAHECELTIYLMERQVIAMHTDYADGLRELLRVLPAPKLAEVAEEYDEEAKEILQAEPLSAVPVVKPAVNRRRLELDYLENLRADVLFDLEKYTPLGGESHFIVQIQQGKPLQLAHMKPEFEHLALRGAEKTQETRRFDNAVEEILSIKRAILLGEPGGGKTTTLLSLAGTLADVSLHDPKAPIPIFVRLGRWTKAEQSLEDFIAGEMDALGAHLPELITQGRAVPLLDGMNEIPVSQRKEKYQQIRTFITGNPDWVAVTTCREQDYTIDLELDRITITPLDALRIRGFVRRYLGDDDGETLFWKIVGEEGQHFKTRFQELFADKLENWQQIFWLANNLPGDLEWKYELYNGFRYSWQLWCNFRDSKGSLIQLAKNPYMLSMLTQVFVAQGDLPDNRGELFRDFVLTLLVREGIVSRDKSSGQVNISDEAYDLQHTLAELAYEMQVQLGQSDDGNALTVLPVETVRVFLNPRQMYLSSSTSILDIGESVRFTHQLLQEYFAAVALNGRIFKHGDMVSGDVYITGERKLLKASDIWTAPEWWQRTNWEEAVILLAGLYSDDCTKVVEWVNQANPEVAALCITRSGAALADSTKTRLQAEWIQRLTDINKEPDPRARAAVGRALGLTNWDNRKGVSTIEEKTDEGVITLPDIDWVEIPPGEFIYQDGEKTMLSAFSISRYPVTYAQFQTFIDDPEGWNDQRWWKGLAIPKGHNNISGDQEFKYTNHPRERVSWYDAIAFCRWFSQRLGGEYDLKNINTWLFRLPTEQEWERFARWIDGRTYPWGSVYQEGYANIDETDVYNLDKEVGKYFVGKTSPVGIYPQGSSSEGVLDAAGNIWEWCLTDYNSSKILPTTENIVGGRRVLKGGSWNRNYFSARCRTRYSGYADDRNYNFGFRLITTVSLK